MRGQSPQSAPSTTQDRESRLLPAALAYAQRGVPVFPCVPGGKAPLTKRGFLDATPDPDKIREWWEKYPEANIGVPTGLASGILSLDLDTYKPHACSLEDLEAEYGPLPKTTSVSTGRSGLQLLFSNPPGESLPCKPEGKLGSGVGVKANGGYIIVPPSVTEGAYEWLNKAPLAEPPV